MTVPSSSSSSLSLSPPSSLSMTASGHWSHPSHAHTHSPPHHSNQHSNGQRSYESADHEPSASSSYSATWGPHPSQTQSRQHWGFVDGAYNDNSFSSHSTSHSSVNTNTNGYYSNSSYPSSSNSNLSSLLGGSSSGSSSLTNAVGSFSYPSLSGSTSLASSTLPSSSSTSLSSHQERPSKLEPASWNPHAEHQQNHQSHQQQSQSQFYPLNSLTINSHVDLSVDDAMSMSPLTPISPSISLSSPPSRSGTAMKGMKIKQEDDEVEHTDGFVFEMPGPAPSHHPFSSPSSHDHSQAHSLVSSPNLLGNSTRMGRSATLHRHGQGQVRGGVVPQFSPMSVVPLRATQASADMKKMMGAFRLDPFTMQNGLGERASRKRSNTTTNADGEKGSGKGRKRKGSKASMSVLLELEEDLELIGEEEGLGKNWLGEDIGPLIGDTVLVEFEVGLIEPLLDPSVYPSTSSSSSSYPSANSNSNTNWYRDQEDLDQDDALYGNERGRRGLGPSESNMMPFLSVVALSPRDYSLGSAHQALVARHLVAGEPAPKPLVNLSACGSGSYSFEFSFLFLVRKLMAFLYWFR